MSDILLERLQLSEPMALLRTKDVQTLVEHIEELKKELREMSLQVLASEGQAQENYQLYVDANEARLDLKETLRDTLAELKGENC